MVVSEIPQLSCAGRVL